MAFMGSSILSQTQLSLGKGREFVKIWARDEPDER